MARQTHTYVARMPQSKEPQDCMLCGKVISAGDLCEETKMETGPAIWDYEMSWCCRECTEPECLEEYERAEQSTETCDFCRTMNSQAKHNRMCKNR